MLFCRMLQETKKGCKDEEILILSALENINRWIVKYFLGPIDCTVCTADVMFSFHLGEHPSSY